MAIKEYLETHEVFTTKDFARAFPDSQSDRNLLARAVRNNAVARPRRGLYISTSGQFSHSTPNPLNIAAAVTDDAVFCYLSALDVLGIAHDASSQTHFYTHHEIDEFQYNGQTYIPHHIGSQPIDEQTILAVSGHAYRTTSKEQTLVDCLKHLSLAGGPEHLLRAIGSLAYLDIDKTLEIAQCSNQSTIARLGWVLDVKHDDWDVTQFHLMFLENSVRRGPHYFWSSTSPKDSHWVNRWRLYLPFPEQEMILWMRP